MINTTNYAGQIVANLEAKGYTKDMMIGYLEGTINGLRYLNSHEIHKYLTETIKHTEEVK